MAIQLTPYQAVAIAEGYDAGQPFEQETVQAAWQFLHDTGLAYQEGMPVWFPHTAQALIARGVIENGKYDA